MSSKYLREDLTFSQARIEVITEDDAASGGKNLYLKGICIEGDMAEYMSERVAMVTRAENVDAFRPWSAWRTEATSKVRAASAVGSVPLTR